MARCPHCQRGGVHRKATRCHHCSGEFEAYSETPAGKAAARRNAIIETALVFPILTLEAGRFAGWVLGLPSAIVIIVAYFRIRHLSKFRSE